MRPERRSVAEDCLPHDLIVVVDIETSGEDGLRQAPKVPDLPVNPTGRIHRSRTGERITDNHAGGIDFESSARIAPGEGSQVDHSSARSPHERNEVRGRLALDIRITDHCAEVVHARCAADASTSYCPQVPHASTLSPQEGVLS